MKQLNTFSLLFSLLPHDKLVDILCNLSRLVEGNTYRSKFQKKRLETLKKRRTCSERTKSKWQKEKRVPFAADRMLMWVVIIVFAGCSVHFTADDCRASLDVSNAQAPSHFATPRGPAASVHLAACNTESSHCSCLLCDTEVKYPVSLRLHFYVLVL